MALNKDANNPHNNLAVAFRELAERAEKISTLSITPDLLESLVPSPQNK